MTSPLRLKAHSTSGEATFQSLGPEFYTHLEPTPLPDPYWVGRSRKVAEHVGVSAAWMDSDPALQMLTGNTVQASSSPLASVYSGHQFGVWAGQLGDGRAILLGETEQGLEVQLKGAGPTPYSRRGDGRAVLRSSIREFLCSEAMHGLGIPTTRALCVTGSDAPVRRETLETAAVVTRVAPSFIRFGHFEHMAASGQDAALKTLADYVVARYYPQCLESDALKNKFQGNPYACLLHEVTQRTAVMVAHWQTVGFCHGVMNTDNMSILGLTMDYGPFQFLDAFDPNHICNHSDTQGRYAFKQQPNVAYWNLFCLGQALMPLVGEQDLAVQALESFKTHYPQELHQRYANKLGLGAGFDVQLLQDLLDLLAKNRVDHTIFWRRLSHFAQTDSAQHATNLTDLFLDRPAFGVWLKQYAEVLSRNTTEREAAAQRMLRTNPKFVLRNHLGETAIRQAQAKDFSGVATLLGLLDNPFDEHPGMDAYADFPPDWASSIEISCSS